MKMTKLLFVLCVFGAVCSLWMIFIHTWPWNMMYAMVFGGVFGLLVGADDTETCASCFAVSNENRSGQWVCNKCLRAIYFERQADMKQRLSKMGKVKK
jgi:hypothetical protein